MNEKPARHLSSVAVKIFLTAVFVFLAAVIVAPFMAELQFNTAQKLAQKYLWQNARQKFESAMCIDPLDATRPAGFADFLKTISSPHPDGDYLLMNSVNLYKRALELDPFNAEYALRLGEVELALFTRSEAKNNFVLIRALDYFKLALKNDPNGFNTSYEVGYRGVEVWPYLNTGFKKLIVERLRYVLGQEYWYSRYIYPQVWQHTNDFKVLERITPPNERTHRELLDFLVVNNLYQFRKKEIEAVDFYMKKEEPEKFLRQEREKEEMFNSIKKEALKRPSMQSIISSSDWHGKTPDGKNDFIKGEMCWSGSMSAALLVPEWSAPWRYQ